MTEIEIFSALREGKKRRDDRPVEKEFPLPAAKRRKTTVRRPEKALGSKINLKDNYFGTPCKKLRVATQPENQPEVSIFDLNNSLYTSTSTKSIKKTPSNPKY